MRYRFAACLFFILGGCASTPPAIVWSPPVNHSRGTFLWQYHDGSLVGEAMIFSDPQGNVSIHLTKNLPRPLLDITLTANQNFRISGPLSRGGWSGDVSRTPVQFSLWASLASAWRAKRSMTNGRQEIHTATYRAAFWKESGNIRELSVHSQDSGEVIRFVFR